MKFKHFIILAATCIGAFVAYQYIATARDKEQCLREAVFANSSVDDRNAARLACAMRYGRYTPPDGQS